MKKKAYSRPAMSQHTILTTAMLAASRLDALVGDQSIHVTDEEYNGEFSSRGFAWTPQPEDWEE
ncbi:MAG: hypothetical protein SPL50_06685 [Alloprevotella sp.]|nr:hypothetical protein [Alloprevotella sp.]